VKAWAGRHAQRLTALVLLTKGNVCHLCDQVGADSADHNPPRSVLIASGVADPDDLAYLFPAHRYPCNVKRKAREITEQLRDELREARRRHLQRLDASTRLSPSLARRRPTLLRAAHTPGRYSFPPISPRPRENFPESEIPR